MNIKISATEAVRSFSEIVNRVRYRGESFVVERGGETVCRIEPAVPSGPTMAEFVELLRTAPAPDAEFKDDVNAVIDHQPEIPQTSWES